MKLDDVEMRRILPSVIRNDPYHVAMSEVVDDVAKDVWAKSRLLTVWDHLGELPESYLDRLAEALHIEWYDSGADIEVKRDVILHSDLVHAKKGTVAAVESVITSYFGDGRLMEWFEYGGDPFHFKVFTTNPTLVAQNQVLCEMLIDAVKRHSTKLDSIIIGLTGQEWAHLCNGARDFAYERQGAGIDRCYVWGTVGAKERETCAVSIGDVWPVTLEQAEEALR